MASLKSGLLAHVAESVDDRQATAGQGGEAPARSSVMRQAEGRRRLDAACLIRTDRIIPDPDQPRKEFDEAELADLTESFKARGQLQPVRVRWDDAADRYMIVLGERRWRAAVRAGLETLACVVTDGKATAEDTLEDQLIENALRSDLKPVEMARAFRALMDRRGLTQVELAGRLRISQPTIARTLGLLDLPPDIQADVDDGSIPATVGYELVKVTDPAERAELAEGAKAGRVRREDIQKRAKGRGAAKGKARRITSRTIRTSAGRVEITNAKGLTPSTLLHALREAVALVERESEGDSVAGTAA